MSYEHGTTHYNLPLTEGSDKRDWFDTNQAFTDIDAAIYSASEAASAASADVAVITSDLSALTTRVTDAEADIDNLEATQSTQGEQMILLANEVSTIETRTGNKFNSVAVKDAYSPTSTYSVGDYVTYDGNLYQCDVAITTGEPFDADKWHAVDLMTLIEAGGGGAEIDDNVISPTKVWSSSKVNSQLATKAAASNLVAGSLTFQFATDGAGHYGYKDASNNFVPFSSGGQAVEVIAPSGSDYTNMIHRYFTDLTAAPDVDEVINYTQATSGYALEYGTATYTDQKWHYTFSQNVYVNGVAYASGATLEFRYNSHDNYLITPA